MRLAAALLSLALLVARPAAGQDAPPAPAEDDPLPPGAVARLGTTRFVALETPLALAYSPDGTILAGGGDSTVTLWDARTGVLLDADVEHDALVNAIAFSPAGDAIVSGSIDGVVMLTDPLAGTLRWMGPKGTTAVLAVAFAPDGKLVAVSRKAGAIDFLDPRNGRSLRTAGGPQGGASAIAFSPDGRRLAAACADAKVRLIDPTSGEVASTLDGSAVGVAFSRDGKTLASVDRVVRFSEVETGRELRRLERRLLDVLSFQGLVWSPAGAPVIAWGSSLATLTDGTQRGDGAILWIDPATGEETRRILIPAASSVVFSPDGKQLAVGIVAGGPVRFFDVASGSELDRPDHPGPVARLAFSPDGKSLAAATAERVVLWDVEKRAKRREIEHGTRARAVAFAPDGARVAVSGNTPIGDPQLVRLHDIATGAPALELRASGGDPWTHVRAVAFSADGVRLACAGDDGVRLFHVPERRELWRKGERSACVDFAPDDKSVAFADGDRLRLISVATGDDIWSVKVPGRSRESLAFSPDSKRIVTTGYEDARVTDAATGKEVLGIDGGDWCFNAVAWSPDGARLAFACADGTVRLHDASTGRAGAVLEGHLGRALTVAFSPDGKHIASGGEDTTILIWKAPAPE